MANHQDRVSIINQLQNIRNSKVIAYVTGDRQGLQAQIGQDAIRPMFEHIRCFGPNPIPKIDLFLYTQGGAVSVPWPMVTMLREFCNEFNLLVPYKSHSAGTLIALGADHITMSRKGELGPIDPILTRTSQNEKTVVQEPMSVEDIMAYVSFLKERAGLGDQAALGQAMSILADKLNPWTLGSIYRTYSHIRMIARKLLLTHETPLEERQINSIIETLAEKMYFHGHAIGRKEAIEIGLPVEAANEETECLLWELLETYEDLMELRKPLDASIIPPDKDEIRIPVILASIESDNRLDLFKSNYLFRNFRAVPPQLNMNLNLNLQFPPNIDPNNLPQQAQLFFQQLLSQVQQQAIQVIQAEIKRQAPILKTEGELIDPGWVEATSTGL